MARSHTDLTANEERVVANGRQVDPVLASEEAIDEEDSDRKLEDEDDSDEVTSSIEDLVDTAELQPYQPGKNDQAPVYPV